MKNFLILTLLFASILGCATRGERLPEVDNPLHHIKAAVISAIPVGVAERSDNNRQFTSDYFWFSKGKFIDARKYPRRKQAIINILGDRRPYTILVQVSVEKKSGVDEFGSFKYTRLKTDKKMSAYIIRNIKKSLDKRRGEINFIDDFRVF